MARTHINFRTWAALILLGLLVVLFASLGNWQLDRAAQRDAIHAQIEHAAQIPPITLATDTPDADLIAWRRAQAQGRWLHQYTVLLENRNYNTRPGYWVATPLQLSSVDSPSADGPAVLVLRGWLARDDVTRHTASGASQLDAGLGHELAQATGEYTVSGELFPHVPRLFELWSWSDSGGAHLPAHLTDTRENLPTVQNLDLADYASATGLELLPAVLAEISPESPMVQDWPHPSSDSDTNRGYAVQWFSFCVIAAGAWLFIAWRVLRKYFNRRTPL